MDHVATESMKIYGGTAAEGSFKIFHDGLSLWWEKDSQDYLNSIGFKDRQIRCTGETNSNNRYKGKLVGDSPELCRGLDSHGFADLKTCVNFHTQLSNALPANHPSRFKTGTPDEMWSSMVRCWNIAPDSERIIEDIEGFKTVLEKIVENRGCIVHDEDIRTGRRARRSDGKPNPCKRNPQTQRRVKQLHDIPIHTDLSDVPAMIEVKAWQELQHVMIDDEVTSDSDSEMREDD